MVLEVQDDNFFCNVVVNNLLLNLTVNKLLLDLIVNNLLLDLILNDLLELVRKETLHWGWNEQLIRTSERLEHFLREHLYLPFFVL